MPKPNNRKIIGFKQNWRVKKLKDHLIDKLKSCVIAQGFDQIRFDFQEIFSHVLKPITIQFIILVALSKQWKLYQLDINDSFLNGCLEEEFFMMQPPSFEHSVYPNHVCIMYKEIYGLKQAPRTWFDTLAHALLRMGFVKFVTNTSLFVCFIDSSIVYLIVYVDNIVIVGRNELKVREFIHLLNEKFDLKHMGYLHYFLVLRSPSQLRVIWPCLKQNRFKNRWLKLRCIKLNHLIHQCFQLLLLMLILMNHCMLIPRFIGVLWVLFIHYSHMTWHFICC